MNDKPIHLDFLVIGTQKAGTTSLHDWLVQHDDICLPALKETHFFSHEERFKNGIEWYLNQFGATDRTGKLVGEIDPEYMYVDGVAEKIKHLTDVKKIVVILRNPLQRAYSQYLMTVRRGFEDLPFEQAVLAENDRLLSNKHFAREHQSYVSRGSYSGQIERYLSTFPEAKFHFVKFDDLVSQTKGEQTYKDICGFIGTKYVRGKVDRSKSSNQAAIPRFVWLRNLIYRKGERSLFRKMLASILSDDGKLRLFVFLDRLNHRNLSKSEIRSLDDFIIAPNILIDMAKDIDKTQSLTGLVLSDWQQQLHAQFNKSSSH